MPVNADIKELLAAGAHFGHKTSRWHPKMAPYIHSKREGAHIINLEKTVEALDEALPELTKLAAKGMLNGIIENGRAERAYIGVAYTSVTPDIAKAYDLPVRYGAYLRVSENSHSSAIVTGGPAYKAGLQDGDIITKIGGVQIGSAGSLSSLVSEYKVGDTIEIEYIRGTETRTTNVTLEAYKN